MTILTTPVVQTMDLQKTYMLGKVPVMARALSTEIRIRLSESERIE